MAFYFLNCSVDAPDIQFFSQQENLKFNDQESIVELLVEKVLGFENAFLEQDDVDGSPQKSMKKSISLDYFVFQDFNSFKDLIFNWDSNKKQFLPIQLFDSVSLEITSPPPLI
jgi:hypothetical protein